MHQVDVDPTLISVIVPIYNAEKYLEETLQSVLNQTFHHWELLLVDDGSTDGTSVILNRLSENHQITVIHQENSGVSSARNNGAKHGRGGYFCFLDADDLLTKDCLQKRMSRLTERKNHFVHNDIEVILSDGTKTNAIKSGLAGKVVNDLLRWEQTVVPGPSSIMISRECFDSVGGFDENLSTAADQDFFIRAAEKFSIDRIPEVLTLYRVHDQNMHKNIALMESDHVRVFQKAAQHSLFQSFWFQQRCFANLYLILAANWWGDGKNKLRSLFFIFRAIVSYPPILVKIAKRLSQTKSV